MQVIDLKQGTPEWLEWRKSVMTASDAPVVMGVSKFKKYDELLKEKHTGESKPISKQLQAIFDEGHRHEELARPLVEEKLGQELYPVVTVHDDYPWLAASFDGITIDNSVIFEHKVLRDSDASRELFNEVKQHRVPDYYLWQVYQQLYVSGADKCLFVVSDGTAENMAIATVEKPSNEEIEQLLDAWHEFRATLDTMKQTDLSGLDEIGKRLAQAKERLEQAKAEHADLQKQAIDFVTQANLDNAETDFIKVSNVERKGAIDYKSIPELAGVDCEQYRKPSTSYFKVSTK